MNKTTITALVLAIAAIALAIVSIGIKIYIDQDERITMLDKKIGLLHQATKLNHLSNVRQYKMINRVLATK